MTFVSFLLAFSFSVILGQKSLQLKKEREKLIKEIQQTTEFLQKIKASKKSHLTSLVILEKQISKREKLISNLEKTVDMIKQEIQITSRQINILQKEIDTLRKTLGQIINFFYIYHMDNYPMMYLLASNTLWNGIKRYIYISQISREIEKYQRYLDVNILHLQNTYKVLDKKIREHQQVIAKLNEEKSTLFQEKIDQERLIKEFSLQEKKLLTEINQKERKLKELHRMIEEAIAAEEKSQKKLLLAPQNAELSKNFEDNKSKLPWPIQKGIVVEKFGKNPHMLFKNIEVFNNGINIETEMDAVVSSVFNGYVSAIVIMGENEKAVLIRHGKYTSVYFPLKKVFVNTGQEVKTKTIIGIVAGDPLKNSAELHFEIWKEKEPLDPLEWLYRGAALVAD